MHKGEREDAEEALNFVRCFRRKRAKCLCVCVCVGEEREEEREGGCKLTFRMLLKKYEILIFGLSLNRKCDLKSQNLFPSTTVGNIHTLQAGANKYLTVYVFSFIFMYSFV